MPRRNHQHIRRTRQARERISRHRLFIQGHIHGHFAFVFEIHATAGQNSRGDMHLLGPLGHRIAEGRERNKRHARLKAQIAGHLGPAFGDIGQILFVRPFMDQCVPDQHNLALVQHCGNAHRPCRRIGIKHMIDQAQNMRRFPCRACHKPITVTMRQHQRRKHMPVTRGHPVNILTVIAFALQALVQKFLVLIEIARVSGIHHLKLAHRIGQAGGLEFGFHIVLTADNQSLAHARALIHHRRTQHARIVALGKDHRRLRRAGAGVQAAQDVRGRIHPRFQAQLVSVHIDNRTPRRAGIHPCPGHGRRNAVDQTRVKRCGNDIITAKGQLLAVSHRHFVGHIFTGQFGQRLGTGDFHFVVDRAGVNVQRPPEQIGKAQHVVHLVRVIRPARCNNRIGPHLMRLFRRNLGIGVRHGENHGVVAHVLNHVLRHRPFGRHAKEHIRPHHRLFQRPQFRDNRMGRFPLVHALGPALIDHALGVANDAVLVASAHRLQQLDTGNPRRPRTVQNDPAILDLLAADMQRVDQTRRADHRRAMLIIVEDRNVHFFLQALLDDETFRRLDILKIDPAKGRPHQPDRAAKLVRVFGVQLDIDRVYIGKALEQYRLALHHRL